MFSSKLLKFNIGRHVFGNPLGLKVLENVLLASDEPMQTSIWKDNLFQGTKTLLGRKVSHSSTHMASQISIYQNLPDYPSVQSSSMASAEPRR